MEFVLKNKGNEEYAFEYVVDENVVAEIEWTELADIMVMNHTFVDPSLRGQGVAKKLLDRAAQYAREKGYKAEAVCSYVVTAFNQSSDYDDIKA